MKVVLDTTYPLSRFAFRTLSGWLGMFSKVGGKNGVAPKGSNPTTKLHQTNVRESILKPHLFKKNDFYRFWLCVNVFEIFGVRDEVSIYFKHSFLLFLYSSFLKLNKSPIVDSVCIVQSVNGQTHAPLEQIIIW